MPSATPIIDYATLQTNVAGWLDRTDLATVVPVLIRNAEARFNRLLRVRDMEHRATASNIPVSVDAEPTEFIDLPDDFLQMKRVRPMTGPSSKALRYLTFDQFQDLLYDNIQTSAVPTSFSIFRNQIAVAPRATGSFTLEIMYYGTIPNLTDLANTNWLLTKHPDAYLYGALVESAPYLRDDDRLALWTQMRDRVIGEIQNEDDASETAGGRMVNRSRPIA